MDAEEICDQLGLQVQRKWTAGSKRETPIGTSLEGRNRSTYCCFGLEARKGYDLEDSLIRWNETLSPHKRFFKRIRSTGGSVEYFIGMYFEKNSGVEFNVTLLKQLVDLGIELSIDLYGGPAKKKRSVARKEK
jgi:hypothetical protein